jgi:hypothetical protein
VLAGVLVGLVVLAVIAIILAGPSSLEPGQTYTDDFTAADASLFSECLREQACPVIVDRGRLRFDVQRPFGITNVFLDVEPSQQIRSITMSSLVFPGVPAPGVAGGPACGWGAAGVTAQLFGDGTLQLADVSTAEPIATTSTPAVPADASALVRLTCSQPTAAGDVAVEAERVGQPGDGDQEVTGSVQATVPANRSLDGAGFAAQSGETVASVHFDDLEIRVD